MKRFLLIAALCALSGCYHAPGNGPAPPSGSAAARCFPELAKNYAEIDRDAASKEFKSHADLFEELKAARHAALEAGFSDVSAEFDAHFEKDDAGNLKWDSDKAKAALNDEAKGFGGK